MKKTRSPSPEFKSEGRGALVVLVRDEGRSCGNGWSSRCCFVNISDADKRHDYKHIFLCRHGIFIGL